MKHINFVIVLVLLTFVVNAQSPVKWKFSSKKLADKNYEIHITAIVQSPWSIYSQDTPDGGPLPTTFSFNKNPLVELDGKVKEQGTMKKKHEEVFGVDVHYYKDKVDFVQKVKLKSKAKTTITGKLEFMACDDEQCLPPKEVSFTIPLQ